MKSYLTVFNFAATSPTIIEVVVDELCIKTVTRIPIIKPTENKREINVSNCWFLKLFILLTYWIAQNLIVFEN